MMALRYIITQWEERRATAYGQATRRVELRCTCLLYLNVRHTVATKTDFVLQSIQRQLTFSLMSRKQFIPHQRKMSCNWQSLYDKRTFVKPQRLCITRCCTYTSSYFLFTEPSDHCVYPHSTLPSQTTRSQNHPRSSSTHHVLHPPRNLHPLYLAPPHPLRALPPRQST
jgi:hypothetical protein